MFPIIEEQRRWTLWTGFIIMINTNSDRPKLNKTKYFRLRRYDAVWLLSECLLNALWVLFKWVWAKKMKIESFRQTRLSQMDERMDEGWAPVRAKKIINI